MTIAKSLIMQANPADEPGTMLDSVSRVATVDRERSAEAALEATGMALYTDATIMMNLPKGKGSEVRVVYFQCESVCEKGYISHEDVEKEYERRNLKPADPISLAAVIEGDPEFVDSIPHGMQWRDSAGKICWMVFSTWQGDRYVEQGHADGGWHGRHWWFAGFQIVA